MKLVPGKKPFQEIVAGVLCDGATMYWAYQYAGRLQKRKEIILLMLFL
jgi:hypothetical protein